MAEQPIPLPQTCEDYRPYDIQRNNLSGSFSDYVVFPGGMEKQTKSLTNLIHESGFLIPRPAVTTNKFQTGAGWSEFTHPEASAADRLPRGAFNLPASTNLSYAYSSMFVNKNSLYRILFGATDGAVDGGSNIPGEGIVRIAQSNTETVIVCPNDGEICLVDHSDSTFANWTVTRIEATSNFETALDVAHINGRMVFAPKTEGNPCFYTNVNDFATVAADSYFDAEELPDSTAGLFNLKNDLYLLGRESIEVFRDTGDSSAPFRRIDGARMPVGYVTARAAYEQGFVFIGRDVQGRLGIYYVSGGVAERISDRFADWVLGQYSIDALNAYFTNDHDAEDQPHIDVVDYLGRTLLILHLPRETLIMSGGSWSYAKSPGKDTLTPKFSLNDYGNKYNYALGSGEGIGMWTAVGSEYGDPIEYEAKWFARSTNNKEFRASNLTLNVDYNHDSANTPVTLETSEDGVNWGPKITQNIWRTNQVNFNPPGGFGRYFGWMGLRVKAKGTAQFAVDGATIDLE